MKVKLSKPIKVGDKEIAEVTLDVDALTGADIDQCFREASVAGGGGFTIEECDKELHAQVAAKLSGLDRALFRTMNGRDYIALLKPIRSFFLGAD